jgi:spore coat polysaccharide biosynthesis protein SpsF (cytidylyltransferase family)/aryl-alcohol dehydrogenase-like predicted oxidoreductase
MRGSDGLKISRCEFDIVVTMIWVKSTTLKRQMMSSVVVLQARTNSSRLPGKVLLPVGGLPLVVLAAQRAGNTGRNVIVATSIEFSDDELANIVEANGLRCFRGGLENTLDRIVNALSCFDEQTIVFRLTADNVFPDGNLLDEMEVAFLEQGLAYLCCNGEPSGLPYGVSVELTRLSHLREAARASSDPFDQEHVTPYVIRKFGCSFFDKYKSLGKGHFRCTVDCLDDYLAVQKVFAGVDEPTRVSCFELVRRLESAPFQPTGSHPVPRLVFGTAQLGGSYGIANKTGRPDNKTCEAMIKTAVTNGILYLDTARAYGVSEEAIGDALKNGWEGRTKIITKLSPLEDCPANAPPSIVRAFVDASVFQSCTALRVRKLDVLMLHRAAHLTAWNRAAWERLIELQASSLIEALGVSVQNPDELMVALNAPQVRYIQLPFNLMDWRWNVAIPEILATKVTRSLTVHVRSVLLQGLLPNADNACWLRANVETPESIRHWLLHQVDLFQRESLTDLCLAYVGAQPWVDGVVIGMENLDQLFHNIHLSGKPSLTEAQTVAIQQSRPILGEATLNPVFWRQQT